MGNSLPDNRICPHCSNVLAPGSLFCVKCGRSLVGGTVKKKKSGLSVRYVLLILILAVTFMLVSIWGGWQIIEHKKKSHGTSFATSAPSKSEKPARPVPVKPSLISRVKTLLVGLIEEKSEDKIEPNGESPHVTKVPTSSSAGIGKSLPPVEWNIKINLIEPPGHPEKRFIMCRGSFIMFDGTLPRLKLYSSSVKDGNYKLCCEAGLTLSNSMRMHPDRHLEPELILNKLNFTLKDNISTTYRRNNVWYRMDLVTLNGILLKTLPPVKVPLFSSRYDFKSKKYVYSVPFPNGGPIDVILIGDTRAHRGMYKELTRLTSTYEYSRDGARDVAISSVMEIYPDGDTGWVKTSHPIRFSMERPARDAVLLAGIDYKGSYLVWKNKQFRLAKLRSGKRTVYPDKLVYNGKMYLSAGENVSGLTAELEDVRSKRLKFFSFQIVPTPPPVTVGIAEQGLSVSWGDLDYLLKDELWLVKPKIMLIREYNIKHRSITSVVSECGTAAGSIIDLVPATRRKEVKYYLELQGGVFKSWYYDAGMKRNEYLYKVYAFRKGQNSRGLPKDADQFQCKARVAIEPMLLYHDNTGPIATRIVTALRQIAVAAARIDLLDRENEQAIIHEMTMTQSLEKVKAKFDLKAKPVDYIFQVRDRSTANGDFVELWLGRLKKAQILNDNMQNQDANASYNNIWRIGRIRTSDSKCEEKILKLAEAGLAQVDKLSKFGRAFDDKNGRPVAKIVWNGLVPVNQAQPVDFEILSGISESVMLVASESMDNGEILTRENWALVRQERDFSTMNGNAVKTDAGGDVLVSGSVVKNGRDMEYHFCATEIVSGRVIGGFRCSGSPDQVGQALGKWCSGLKVAQHTKFPYSEKMVKSLLNNENRIIREINRRYAKQATFSSGPSLSHTRRKVIANAQTDPVEYAAKQWAIGNRKYAIELLEREVKSKGRGISYLASFYYSVGFFEKEKKLLETQTSLWAVECLAKMQEFPQAKPKYAYIDALPDKRMKIKNVPKSTPTHVYHRSYSVKNFRKVYGRLRKRVVQGWNPDDDFLMYNLTFIFNGRELAKFADSGLIRDNGVLRYIGTVSGLKNKNRSMAVISAWQATDIFSSDLPLAMTRALLLETLAGRNVGNSNVYSPFFDMTTRNRLQLLDAAARHLEAPVSLMHQIWIGDWRDRREIKPVNVRQLLDFCVSQSLHIPVESHQTLPRLYLIRLAEIMSGQRNPEAIKYLSWIKSARLPSVEEMKKLIPAESGVNYKIINFLEKQKITTDQVIYLAASGRKDALKLVQNFPKTFFQAQGDSQTEMIYYIVKNLDVDLACLLLNDNARNISLNQQFDVVRYAGASRLEKILLKDDCKLLRNPDARSSIYLNSLVVGLDSQAVTAKMIEKYHKQELDYDGKSMLVQLVGKPLNELEIPK